LLLLARAGLSAQSVLTERQCRDGRGENAGDRSNLDRPPFLALLRIAGPRLASPYPALPGHTLSAAPKRGTEFIGREFVDDN
jgi:hypothetical protein